jgi:hypothetical protein
VGWAIVYGTAGVVFVFLLNAPELLKNLRILPEEVSTTIAQYESWVYEDAEWTGNWSSYPEGIVDMEDMHLSDTDLKITIWATQGRLDGTIVNKAVCKIVPLQWILLSGSVSGNGADVMAWDIRQGKKTRYAQLTFSRDGDILTVKSTLDPAGLFPTEVRIGRHPADEGKDPEPDATVCEEIHRELIEKYKSQPQQQLEP